MWALSLLVGLVVVFMITAATGFFVAQEFSYVAVNRSRLKSRAAADDGERGPGIVTLADGLRRRFPRGGELVVTPHT